MSDQYYAQMNTGTRITPEYFQFTEVVPEEEFGGWRAVCISAKVGQRVAHPQGANLETEVKCDIEVGVPISNRQHGYIPLREAQRISADIANQAAYTILQRSKGLMTFEICKQIIEEMGILLDPVLRGSKVTKCGVTKWSHQVPVVAWPGPTP